MYTKFFVLFAIIFTGFALRKSKFIDEKINDGLNKFIVYFAYPCLLVFNIGTIEMKNNVALAFGKMLSLSIILFVLYGLVSAGYSRIRHFPQKISPVAQLSMTMPNNGFMGFPVASIFFGNQGLLLMMAHNVAFNLYCFTFGLYLLRKNKERRDSFSFKNTTVALLKLLTNPNIIATILGFIVYFLKVPLNNGMGEYLSMIGNVATPMAMISIGITLAGSQFWEMFKNRIVWESSLVKLVLIPLASVAFVWFLPIPPMFKIIGILGGCFPAGATVTMLAQQEGENHQLASKILFFSTIFSMATIPLCVTLLEHIHF